MHVLELRIRHGCEEPFIEFHMDGEDLAEMLTNASGGASTEDVLPWFGIDYGVAETVLGVEVRRKGATRAILFACGCGVSACGAVFVRVTVDAETVTLSDFSTGRAVVPLAPLRFDRGEFDNTVERLQGELEKWGSSRPGGPSSI